MVSSGEAIRFPVRVRPNASRTRVGGRYGTDALVVAVSARPVEGQANVAVLAALADAFGVRRSAVALVSGHASRDKIVQIGGDVTTLRNRFAALRDG